MTPEAAIYEFLSGFGIPAYSVSSTPSDADFPYLTYSPVMGDFYGGDVSMEVDLWYYTTSEADPNAKAREIYNAIGMGGLMLTYDGGAIWVKRGNPWCQTVQDGDNESIKRRYINIDLEYIGA